MEFKECTAKDSSFAQFQSSASSASSAQLSSAQLSSAQLSSADVSTKASIILWIVQQLQTIK